MSQLTLVAICFTANVLCYLDRTNISTAIIPMATLYGWDKVQQGYVLSAFYMGYITTQVLGGCLSSQYGGFRVLAGAVVIWSAFTLLTPVAAPRFWAVILARIGMGMGEGLALPAIHSLVSRHVSPKARSRATCFIASGHGIGMIVALLASPMLRWDMMFYVFGSLGYVWVAGCLTIQPKDLKEVDGLSEREMLKDTDDDLDVEAAVVEGTPTKGPVSRSPAQRPSLNNTSAWERPVDGHPSLACASAMQYQSPINIVPPVWAPAGPLATQVALYWSMLRNRHSIAIFSAHFASAWGWYIILSWLPKYLKSLGAETERVGIYAIAPFVSQVVMDIVAGWLADYLLDKGYPRGRLRKIFTAISLAGSGFMLLLLAYLKCRSVFAVTASMTVILGLKGFGHAGFSVNIIDIAPGSAGQLFALSNTLATSAGILGNLTTGWLWQATGTFEFIFIACAIMDIFGTLMFVLFGTGNVVFKT